MQMATEAGWGDGMPTRVYKLRENVGQLWRRARGGPTRPWVALSVGEEGNRP